MLYRKQNKDNSPIVSKALLIQTYVHDIFAGSERQDELFQLYTELNNILTRSGFKYAQMGLIISLSNFTRYCIIACHET